MRVEVETINAFTKNDQGGNPAGVVLGLEGKTFSSKQMQSIAREVNLSETAFVLPFEKKKGSADADYCVLFFTINSEVGLCGHATIAAWTDLYQRGIINPGEYTQQIQAGILRVDILTDGRIIMDQPRPVFKKEFAAGDIASVLDVPIEWVDNTNLTPRVVSTGLNDLMIPIDTREHLFAININDARISNFEEKYGLDSFHMFTLDTVDPSSTANSRNADPFHGIHEESATGSAHGALACYLFQYGIVTAEQAMNGLAFEQGYNLQSPSEIFTRLDIKNNEIGRVQVGGHASFKGSKELEIEN